VGWGVGFLLLVGGFWNDDSGGGQCGGLYGGGKVGQGLRARGRRRAASEVFRAPQAAERVWMW